MENQLIIGVTPQGRKESSFVPIAGTTIRTSKLCNAPQTQVSKLVLLTLDLSDQLPRYP